MGRSTKSLSHTVARTALIIGVGLAAAAEGPTRLTTLLAPWTAPPAHACCNLIPAAESIFPSTLGSTASPVTTPGGIVKIQLTPCDTSDRFDLNPLNHQVRIMFEPPDAGTSTDTEEILDPAVPGRGAFCASGTDLAGQPCTSDADCRGKCAGGTNVGIFCDTDGECPASRCIPASRCLPSVTVADCAAGGCNTLSFVMPLTDAGDCAGRNEPLAGPAKVRVEDKDTLAVVAEIGALSEPTFSCDRQPESVFGHFTVLPTPNVFSDLVSGAETRVRATLDGGNNILIPFEYLAILPRGIGMPIARLLQGQSGIEAFPGGGIPISFPESQQPNFNFVRAFTVDGRPLPPLLDVNTAGELVGSVDARAGVIRIARTDGEVPPLYDFTTRFCAGKGPIVVDRDDDCPGGACVAGTCDGGANDGLGCTLGPPRFSVAQSAAVELKGLRASKDAVAFVREDGVVQLLDVASGSASNTNLQVAQIDSGPALDIQDNLLAFLEPGIDPNGVLRVFTSDGAELTGMSGLDADRTPVLNGRSVAVSGSLVFFRGSGSGVCGRVESTIQPPTAESCGRVNDAVDGTGNDLVLPGTGGSTLTCGNTFIGGGSNLESPFPLSGGKLIFDVADCRDPTNLVLAASSGTGPTDCSQAGCFFVAPVAIPNTMTPAFSACVIEKFTADASGTLNALTGEQSALINISTEPFITGDLDGGKPGIQPCPECIGGLCTTGPNAGLACTPGGITNTSHDCPPPPAASLGVGALLISPLTSGTTVLADGAGLFCPGQGGAPGTAGAFGTAARYVESTGTPPGNLLAATTPSEGRLTATFCIAKTGNVTADTAADLPGPGMTSIILSQQFAFVDSTLQVFDTGTASLRSVPPVDASVAAVADERAVVLTPESGGSLNPPDADTGDQVAQLYEIVGGVDTVTSLGVAASRIAISANLVAVTREEANENGPGPGGTNLNGDGDSTDETLATFDLNSRVLDDVGVASGAIATTEVCVGGSNVGAPCTADADCRVCTGGGEGSNDGDTCLNDGDCDGTCDLSGACHAFVAFVTPESAEGAAGIGCDDTPVQCDLTGDNDALDDALRAYNHTTDTIADTNLAAEEFVVGGRLVAFRTAETAQGNLPCNGDGDLDDDCMNVYDVARDIIYATGQSAIRCTLPGCNPFVPYEVKGDTVSFITDEVKQNQDLDGDGFVAGVVRQVFNVNSGAIDVFRISDDPTCGSDIALFPETLHGGTIVFEQLSETELGTDLNEDGALDDCVMVLEGDADEDGTFDAVDTCTESGNAEQTDSDLDGLGDACDPEAFCTPFAPPAPPLANAGFTAQCQAAIGKATKAYVRSRQGAVRGCLNRIAQGRLTGDPTTVCRGTVTGGVETLPRDERTARRLERAAARLQAKIAATCTNPQVGSLEACADTVADLPGCIASASGQGIAASTIGAYGDVGPLAGAERSCQQTAGAAATGYLKSVVGAMQACLNKWNAGRISGNPVVLCLGALGSGGVVQLPSDASTSRTILSAQTRLDTQIDARCTDTALAALDTCAGAQIAGAGNRAKQCLRCTNWRRAAEIIRNAYGPQ